MKKIFQEVLLLAPVFGYLVMLCRVVNDKVDGVSNALFLTTVFAVVVFVWQCQAYACLWSRNDDFSSGRAPWRLSSFRLKLATIVGLWACSHGTCVLMGAAAFEEVRATSTWALLISALLSPPLLSLIEPDGWLQVVLCGKCSDHPDHFLVYRQVWGTLLGSWASTFTVPLDWDRPWQRWPIPLLFGAVLGFAGAVVVNALASIIGSRGSSRRGGKFH